MRWHVKSITVDSSYVSAAAKRSRSAVPHPQPEHATSIPSSTAREEVVNARHTQQKNPRKKSTIPAQKNESFNRSDGVPSRCTTCSWVRQSSRGQSVGRAAASDAPQADWATVRDSHPPFHRPCYMLCQRPGNSMRRTEALDSSKYIAGKALAVLEQLCICSVVRWRSGSLPQRVQWRVSLDIPLS